MLTGVRFCQLKEGDVLIDKNSSYKNKYGIFAAQTRINDLFSYANKVGFNVVYDTVRPTLSDVENTVNNNELSLIGYGENSNIWPLYNSSNNLDRISIYKQNLNSFPGDIICELELPERLTTANLNKYIEFTTILLSNPQFAWIKKWVIGSYPEELIGGLPKTDPYLYKQYVDNIKTILKSNISTSDIRIGGPGIYKSFLGLSSSYISNGYYANWVNDAIQYGLFDVLDFITFELKSEGIGQYDNLNSLIKDLRDIIGTSKQIYCTNFGSQLLLSEPKINDFLDQAYNNLIVSLKLIKNNINPILNDMLDRVSNIELNPNYDHTKDGYGVLFQDLSIKPQYEVLKFIFNSIRDFDLYTDEIKLYDNIYAESVTLVDKNSENVSTIVWSNLYRLKKEANQVVIHPTPNTYYLLLSGEKNKIINPYAFNALNNFIIINQLLNKQLLNYKELENDILSKYIHTSNIKNSLLNSVPVRYNTESDDTNFYKILRAIAIEMADAEVQIERLKDNFYLESAHNNAIYQNFGSMVNLKKQPEWNNEKYRRLIQGVTKSLLNGPSKQSMEEAINLFVNYDNVYGDTIKIADVKIHELYNDDTLDPAIYNGINPQYLFVVEVNKNLDVNIDQQILNRDITYVVNVLKPAHTLSFLIVILTGEENYPEWYEKTHFDNVGNKIKFENLDTLEDFEINYANGEGITEGIYGWDHYSNSIFKTFNQTNINNSVIGKTPIAPSYFVNDKNFIELTQDNNKELIDMSIFDKNQLTGYDNYESRIRYGYYKDEDDNVEDGIRDGIVGLKHNNESDLIIEYDTSNTDYGNPDNGEYYKNYWMKNNKITSTNGTANTKNYNVVNTKGVINTDVQFEQMDAGDLPYNEINTRAYRIEDGIKTVFENMDTMSDVNLDIEDEYKYTANIFKFAPNKIISGDRLENTHRLPSNSNNLIIDKLINSHKFAPLGVDLKVKDGIYNNNCKDANCTNPSHWHTEQTISYKSYEKLDAIQKINAIDTTEIYQQVIDICDIEHNFIDDYSIENPIRFDYQSALESAGYEENYMDLNAIQEEIDKAALIKLSTNSNEITATFKDASSPRTLNSSVDVTLSNIYLEYYKYVNDYERIYKDNMNNDAMNVVRDDINSNDWYIKDSNPKLYVNTKTLIW